MNMEKSFEGYLGRPISRRHATRLGLLGAAGLLMMPSVTVFSMVLRNKMPVYSMPVYSLTDVLESCFDGFASTWFIGFSILSLFLSIVAYGMGRSDKIATRVGRMKHDRWGLTTIGHICGILGIIMSVFCIFAPFLFILLFFVILA